MKLLRHAPLTLWVVVLALLAGAALFAVSLDRPADAAATLAAAPTEADKAQVSHLRNRLGVLLQLAQDDEPDSAAQWAAELASEARAASVSRAARVGDDDKLVAAYRHFADEAAAVRGADDPVAAVQRVLAAGDLLAGVAFGGDPTTLPPGFGGNLERGDVAGLGERPQLPGAPSLNDPVMPHLDAPQVSSPPTPGLDAPHVPQLDVPSLPQVDPADTASILGIDPNRIRQPVGTPSLPGLTRSEPETVDVSDDADAPVNELQPAPAPVETDGEPSEEDQP